MFGRIQPIPWDFAKHRVHSKMPRKIDCHKCRHYYVTWEKKFPHGCKAMGFKSKQLPSIDVRVSSDRDCLLAKPKDLRKK